MILVKEMSTSGQFVAVWEFHGRVWSGTYYWDDDGELFEWSGDEPLEVGGHHKIFPKSVRYYTLKTS